MKNLRLLLLGSVISLTFFSCMQQGAVGATIASQTVGTYTSSVVTVIVDDEERSDSTTVYDLRIAEVDANTVSVLTPDLPRFEVDLEKSENGEWTTGKTDGAHAGFTFKYYVPEASLEIIYATDNVSLYFAGIKE